MKSNTEWKYWGKKDPLYGVAAWEGREKGGTDPWTDDDFYALGEHDWTAFRSHWASYGLDTGHCVEIGCGAGRLTRFMAETFREISALDVSEAMIAYAREQVPSDHVRFHLVQGTEIPLADMTVDAVFSTHVFQHFDTQPDAAAYFQEIYRVLKPGGSMMIHLPVFSWPTGAGRMIHGLYRLFKAAGKVRADVKRLAIKAGLNVSLMRMTSYEAGWLLDTLTGQGFADIELRAFRLTEYGGVNDFVMARRPARK